MRAEPQGTLLTCELSMAFRLSAFGFHGSWRHGGGELQC